MIFIGPDPLPQLGNPGETSHNGIVISFDRLQEKPDITCLGRFIGPRVSEYAQTSSKKVDRHKYPSGKKFIKAFTANNFVFFNKSGHTLELHDNSCLDQAHTVKITWRIQKNRQNGQKITLSGEKTCLTICAVRAAGQMVLLARRLGQPDNKPVACYS